jgi:zinc protease
MPTAWATCSTCSTRSRCQPAGRGAQRAPRHVENEPYGIVEEALNHALFPQDHPYRASVIGSHTDIQNAKLDDVREFFTRYYGPNNASIVIAGDIDKVKTRALVAKYFGSLRRGPAVVRPTVATPPITSERRLVVPDRVELPRVYMGWLTPPAYQPGDAELAVAAQILAGGKSSRLYKSLVYGRQIAQDVDADQDSRALSLDLPDRSHGACRPHPGRDRRSDRRRTAALRDQGPTGTGGRARPQPDRDGDAVSSLEKLGGDGLADQLNHYNQYTGDPGYLAKDVARCARSPRRRAPRRPHLAAAARARGRGRRARHPGTAAGSAGAEAAKARAKAGAGHRRGINEAEAWRAQMPKAGPAPRMNLPQGEPSNWPMA